MIRVEGDGWYTSDGQRKEGPLPASAIMQRATSGALQPSHFVWKDGLPDWVAAKSLPDLFAPQGLDSAFDPEGFLRSETTHDLIGKKTDFYLKRWDKLLTKTGGNYDLAATKRIWMTAPFFFPYSWLFYRKMYTLGGVVYGMQLLITATVFADLPKGLDTAVNNSSLVLSILVCFLGPGWYLKETRKKWKAVTGADVPFTKAQIAKMGGTNLLAALLAPLVPIAIVTTAIVLRLQTPS